MRRLCWVVQTNLNEDDLKGYRVVQVLSLLIAGGALYAAFLMTRKGGAVYLGLEIDPFEREAMVGAFVGIPTSICGATIAYLAAYERRWGFVRCLATLIFIGNLLIPLTWGVLWLMKSGLFSS